MRRWGKLFHFLDIILIKVLFLARLGAILSPLVRALEIATDKSSIRFLQSSDPDSGRINGFER